MPVSVHHRQSVGEYMHAREMIIQQSGALTAGRSLRCAALDERQTQQHDHQRRTLKPDANKFRSQPVRRIGHDGVATMQRCRLKKIPD